MLYIRVLVYTCNCWYCWYCCTSYEVLLYPVLRSTFHDGISCSGIHTRVRTRISNDMKLDIADCREASSGPAVLITTESSTAIYIPVLLLYILLYFVYLSSMIISRYAGGLCWYHIAACASKTSTYLQCCSREGSPGVVRCVCGWWGQVC